MKLRKGVVFHLSNTLSFYSQSLHLGEVVVVCYHVSDDGLFIRLVHTDICKKTNVKG